MSFFLVFVEEEQKKTSSLSRSYPVLEAKQETTTSTSFSLPSLVMGSNATALRDSESVTFPNRMSAPANSFLVASASALPPTPDFSLEKATTSNPRARSSLTTNLPIYPVGPTTRTRTSLAARER